MTRREHHHELQPWHDLPEGFAERLEQESRLNSSVRSATFDQLALVLSVAPEQIIDLGSGTGADAVALARRFDTARVHTLDVSSELLDHVAVTAEKAGVADRVDRHPVDLNNDWTTVVPAGIDLAWASLSLHHLNEPAVALQRIFAALKPGGVLALIELTDDGRFPIDWSALLGQAGFAPLERHDPTTAADRSVWIAIRPETEAPRDGEAAVDADVAVVGGGFAGLAAAIALARSRRSVVVVDAGKPRNAPAAGAHNVLGNEGIPPLELLARGRTEAESYGVRFLPGQAIGAAGTIDDFSLDLQGTDQRIHARRIILATGLVDDLPPIPGVKQGWGDTVLHCPFCHGWEVRDQRIAILTRDELAMHQVMLFSQLSDRVTVFLNDAPEPSDEQWEQLAAMNVSVVRPRVERLVVEGTQVRAIEIDGGDTVDTDAVVVAPRFNARTELFELLGGVAEQTPVGVQIPADPRGMTPVPGVWVAGNAGQPMAMVMASAASGVMTGAAVHGDLTLADLSESVRLRAAN